MHPAASEPIPETVARSDPEMHGIDRVGFGTDARSWQVVLYRAGGGRLHMTFREASYGGEEPALYVARAWRDAVLQVVPPLGRRDLSPRDRPGIFFKRASAARRAYWVAHFAPEGGRQVVCSFSVATHGEIGARALADAERQRMVAALEGDPFPALPAPAPEASSAGGGRSGCGGFNDAAFYGLSREVAPGGHGRWRVIVQRGRRRVQLNVSDATYGGQAEALHVARALRDALLRVMSPLTKRQWRQLPRKRSTPGPTGVHYREASHGHSAAWTACIQRGEERTLTTRVFSVGVHGELKARALAEAERQHMLDTLDNRDEPHLRSPAALAIAERIASS